MVGNDLFAIVALTVICTELFGVKPDPLTSNVLPPSEVTVILGPKLAHVIVTGIFPEEALP